MLGVYMRRGKGRTGVHGGRRRQLYASGTGEERGNSITIRAASINETLTSCTLSVNLSSTCRSISWTVL